jgi:putative heme-binding domain-containing protein
LGPDLSDIGAQRRPASLEHSLIEPNHDIRADNHTVHVTTQDGSSVTGRLLNQDTYSLQVLTPEGRLASFEKANLRNFEILKTSPMPNYSGKLTTQELADVVSYLVTLKGHER